MRCVLYLTNQSLIAIIITPQASLAAKEYALKRQRMRQKAETIRFEQIESREEICAREESSRAKRKAKSARCDEETRSIFTTKKAGTRGTRTRERAEKSARERKDGERGGDVESEDAKCGIGEVRDAG